MAETYSVEVIQAASFEYIREIDGYGTYAQRYLVCWLRESQLSSEFYVITVFNETRNQPLIHAGGAVRFVTPSRDEAEVYYTKCLYAARQAA